MKKSGVLSATSNSLNYQGEEYLMEIYIRMRPILREFEDEIAWVIEHEKNVISSIDRNKQATVTTGSNNKGFNPNLQDLGAIKRRYADSYYSYSFEFGTSADCDSATLDKVYDTDCTTETIYKESCRNIVTSVLDGFNSTIFMYGQTTSGKTYTMIGNLENPGILPFSLLDIFEEMENRKEKFSFKVLVSYLEIYNEQINDLLSPGTTNLKIMEDPKTGISVQGLNVWEIKSFEQAIMVLKYGEEQRNYKETDFHDHSSRSHTIFQVRIESETKTRKEKCQQFVSVLNLVDLAGSERLSEDDNKTQGAGETGYINKSLFVLSNVIHKLAEGNKRNKNFIPYRDSKLTRILSNSLGGNSRTAIICTISPASLNFYQTLSTLRFADRARNVENKPIINELKTGNEANLNDSRVKEISELRKEITSKNSEVEKVNREKEELEKLVGECNGRIQVLNQEITHFKETNAELNSRKEAPFQEEQFDISPLEVILEKFENLMSVKVKNSPEKAPALQRQYNECIDIIEEYKNQAKLLQNKYLTLLKERVSSYFTTSDRASDYPLENKEMQAVTYGASLSGQEPAGLLELIEKSGMNKNEFINLIKLKYEETLANLDKYYEDYRTLLELYFRNQLTHLDQSRQDYAMDGSTVSLLKITQIHQEKLSKLRDLYEYKLSEIETNFAEILRELHAIDINEDVVKEEDENNKTGSEPSEKLQLKQETKKPEPETYEKILENRPEKSNNTPKFQDGIEFKFAKNFHSAIQSNKSNDNQRSNSHSLSNITFTWGSGKDGRLGNGSEKGEKFPYAVENHLFVNVSAGYYHSAGVDERGRVFSWGKGDQGQLGLGSFQNFEMPQQVSFLNSEIIQLVSCGWQHTLALSRDGKVFSWGLADEGQLGHGNKTSINQPKSISAFDNIRVKTIATGHSHSAAVTINGDLYTWGCNIDYRLMYRENKNQFLPVLTEISNIKISDKENPINKQNFCVDYVSLGVSHSAVITRDGSVYTAGLGNHGQLGVWLSENMAYTILIKSFSEESQTRSNEADYKIENYYNKCSFLYKLREFGNHNRASKVACGENFTIILNEKGDIYTFGKSSNGCLGHANVKAEEKVFLPKVIETLRGKNIKDVSAGKRHSAAIDSSGIVYTWGFNFYDQLGLEEAGREAIIPSRVNLPSMVAGLQVSCGEFHTVCLCNVGK